MANVVKATQFFEVHLPDSAQVGFEDEGQRWAVMDPTDVMNLPNFLPALRGRFRLWLQDSRTEPI